MSEDTKIPCIFKDQCNFITEYHRLQFGSFSTKNSGKPIPCLKAKFPLKMISCYMQNSFALFFTLLKKKAKSKQIKTKLNLLGFELFMLKQLKRGRLQTSLLLYSYLFEGVDVRE